MATNKKILLKGLRFMSGALPLAFIGPIVINSAFKNKENPLYPFVLGIGILVCITSIFLVIWGLKTVMKGIFDGDK
jgi:hypothetical protein